MSEEIFAYKRRAYVTKCRSFKIEARTTLFRTWRWTTAHHRK